MGEAVVVINPQLQDHFKYHLRQRGALLAKSRSVSEQFVEFFKDGLYFANAKHANAMAELMAAGITKQGYTFLNAPTGNQLFPILPNPIIKALEPLYGFYPWPAEQQQPDHSVIRLVTSWATSDQAVEDFLNTLQQLH